MVSISECQVDKLGEEEESSDEDILMYRQNLRTCSEMFNNLYGKISVISFLLFFYFYYVLSQVQIVMKTELILKSLKTKFKWKTLLVFDAMR